MKKRYIAVIGSGSWGTALAQVLADNDQDVILYGNNKEEINDINENHRNSKYFKNLKINEKLIADSCLENIFYKQPDVILLTIPTSAMNAVLNELKRYVKNNIIIVNCAKGFDNDGKGMYECIKTVFPKNKVVSLLGPSHAEEVILRKLTFVDIVDPEDLGGYFISNLFNNFYFKTKVTDDIKSAELGTSMKNAIALMSGIYEGLGFGDNARAALYTDGLSEMVLLGKCMNIKPESLISYSGAGDLAVTCYSNNSRNFTAGLQIGKLNSYTEFSKTNTKTVEGIRTVSFIHELEEKYKIHLPVINCLYNIIYKNVEPLYAVDNLINKKSGIFD